MIFYKWDKYLHVIKRQTFGASPWNWYKTPKLALRARIADIHSRIKSYEIELKRLKKELKKSDPPKT